MNTNTKQERRAAFEADNAAEWAIKGFAQKTRIVANPLTTNDDGSFTYERDAATRCQLEFPSKRKLSHYKAVNFTKIINHPEMMHISSSNYRCEDEANGLYATADARNFYKALIKAGFELN